MMDKIYDGKLILKDTFGGMNTLVYTFENTDEISILQDAAGFEEVIIDRVFLEKILERL